MKIKQYKSFFKSAVVRFWDKIIRRKRASVLMYHSVGENPEFFTVRPGDFRWQMSYLKKSGFNVVPLAELIGWLKAGEKIPSKTVILTFDDGYEDNYANAFPVLKEFNFPATIFLATGRIGDKGYTNKRGIKMPMLDWSQIKEMHESGIIDFEPHTASHPKLTKISREDAEREIILSKETIEKELNKRCKFFSYPYGLYNREIERLVRENFSAVFTVQQGFAGAGDNLLRLGRQSIDSLTGKKSFKVKV